MKKLLSVATLMLSFMIVAHAKPLITDKEAQLPAAKGELKTRGISRGPGVKVMSSDLANGVVKSPFDLKVKFEPRGGNKIDLSSVKVVYLKSPAVDLTDRVKPTISNDGINFEKAEVPPGEHAVRITVKDSEGRETNTVITLMVNK